MYTITSTLLVSWCYWLLVYMLGFCISANIVIEVDGNLSYVGKFHTRYIKMFLYKYEYINIIVIYDIMYDRLWFIVNPWL